MRTLSTIFIFIIISSNVFADVIVSTDITLLTGNKTAETPLTRFIDGSGLSDNSTTATLASVTHNSTDANEARLFDPSPSSVRLDLGGNYDISDAFYWNTNTSVSNDVSTISYAFLDSSLTNIISSGPIIIPGPLDLIQMPSNQYTSPSVISGVRFIDVTFTPRVGATSYAPGEIRFSGVPSLIITPMPGATSIPTLSQWGLILLIGLMFFASFLIHSKR